MSDIKVETVHNIFGNITIAQLFCFSKLIFITDSIFDALQQHNLRITNSSILNDPEMK